jgi:DNA polymerase IIIc chi subunit
MNLRVFFHPVKTAKEKIDAVIKICENHIEKGYKLMILVDSMQTGDYIEKVLWGQNPQSFIPNTKEIGKKTPIFIAESLSNDYSSVLNLTQNSIDPTNSKLTTVYELEDATSKAKMDLSKAKYSQYKAGSHHLHFEAISIYTQNDSRAGN